MEIFFRRKFHPVLGILARDITNQPHFLNTLFKTELKPLKKKLFGEIRHEKDREKKGVVLGSGAHLFWSCPSHFSFSSQVA